jgi:hypothetical protein
MRAVEIPASRALTAALIVASKNKVMRINYLLLVKRLAQPMR